MHQRTAMKRSLCFQIGRHFLKRSDHDSVLRALQERGSLSPAAGAAQAGPTVWGKQPDNAGPTPVTSLHRVHLPSSTSTVRTDCEEAGRKQEQFDSRDAHGSYL